MLTGVFVFLLIVIAVLAIPVTLTYHVSWPQVLPGNTRLQWAFGLVHVDIPRPDARASSVHVEEAASRRDDSDRSSQNNANILAAIRQAPFRQRIVRFIGDLWRAIGKKDVSVRVRVGLDDPADTGRLWAVLGPLSAALANVREASINVEPDFAIATLELDSAGSIRIVPLHMLCLAVGLMLSPQLWQGVAVMRKGST